MEGHGLCVVLIVSAIGNYASDNESISSDRLARHYIAVDSCSLSRPYTSFSTAWGEERCRFRLRGEPIWWETERDKERPRMHSDLYIHSSYRSELSGFYVVLPCVLYICVCMFSQLERAPATCAEFFRRSPNELSIFSRLCFPTVRRVKEGHREHMVLAILNQVRHRRGKSYRAAKLNKLRAFDVK